MNENEFESALLYLIQDGETGDGIDPDSVRSVVPYREVGMLTGNAGLVVTMNDGSEFQVTIVQSKAARG